MSSNYWTLNKTVVDMFGIETAFLLTIFAEAETMMADKDGWFFQTVETIEKMTTLSRYKQDKSIDELVEAGILERDVRGIPAKRYFKLDYNALASKIANHLQTRNEPSNKQEEESPTTNKELKDKELNNKENKDKKGRKYSFDDTHMKLAELLWEHVKTNFPNTKEPNLESWANDIRLMMEQDDRTIAEIKGVIEWSQKHDFWYANIRSAKKLRSQYETMYAQADRENRKKPKKQNFNDPNRYVPKELRGKENESGKTRGDGLVSENDEESSIESELDGFI